MVAVHAKVWLVLVLHTKRCYLFYCMFHGQICMLDFAAYRASLYLYMIKLVYQICVKSLSVIKLQWWWWSVNIMNYILPLAYRQMGKHKSGSIQVYKLTDRHQLIDQPLFPNQDDDNAIQNKWCRGNAINKWTEPEICRKKIPGGLITIPYKKKTANMEWRTCKFSSMGLEWHL